MSILESKIKKNKSEFDINVPSEGHIKRFSNKLDLLHGNENRFAERFEKVLKIAAAILVLMMISSLFVFLPYGEQNQAMAAELPEEIQSAKNYYDNKAQEKLIQIDECIQDEERAQEIKNIAQQEMAAIEKNNQELVEEYKDNPENKKVERALISSFKSKSDVLESIVSRLCRL